MLIWTAFMIGIVGSLHCLGMCGPIAMALPYQDRTPLRTGFNILQYHMGRIVTYALLGGIIGLVGQGIYLAGMQKAFSIGAGVLLLAAAILSLKFMNRFMTIRVVDRFFQRLKTAIAIQLQKRSSSSIFIIGLLNGLLPCGLVYMAIVGAVSTGSALSGMAYMALFGAGTVPLVLAASVAGTFASLKLRNTLRKMVPVFLFGFALLFIMRGLNFDVPIQFSFWESTLNQPMCH